jgi:hypothetical protein
MRLSAFTFGGDTRFEGELVGALERIEVGDAIRVHDGLFVARDRESGVLSAICLSDLPPSRRTSRLLDFRLAEHGRDAATRQALDGPAGDAVRALAAELRPGMAIAVLVVEHTRELAVDPLADAVARLGGTAIVDEPVEARRIADLTGRLVASTQGVQNQ